MNNNDKIFEVLKQNGGVFSDSWLRWFLGRKGISFDEWLEKNLNNGKIKVLNQYEEFAEYTIIF